MMLRLYYWLKDYLETAYEIETITSREHGPLLTFALGAKILLLQIAISLGATVAGGILVVFMNIDALIEAGGIVMASFFLLGYGLSELARAFILHRVFNTQWQNRSFNLPEARVLF